MRSKDFSFGFAEHIGKLMILRRNIEKIKRICKFCRVSLNIWRAKIYLKLLEPRSFNTCKNAVAPIIVILDHLEVNIEISNIGIEIVKSDDCREVSENDRDTNSVLAITWEEARFSCKDGWKFICYD